MYCEYIVIAAYKTSGVIIGITKYIIFPYKTLHYSGDSPRLSKQAYDRHMRVLKISTNTII